MSSCSGHKQTDGDVRNKVHDLSQNLSHSIQDTSSKEIRKGAFALPDVEPVVGLEPTTCCLQIMTAEAHTHPWNSAAWF